jgi:hypothetical protein
MFGRKKAPLTNTPPASPELDALIAKITATYRELDARLDALGARLLARLEQHKEP